MSTADEVGTCPCTLCGAASSVRKFKGGRRHGQLYLVCPKHKQFINQGQDFQDWILDHVAMHGPDGKAPVTEPAAPAVIDPPETQQPPAIPPTPPPAPVRREMMFPLFGY